MEREGNTLGAGALGWMRGAPGVLRMRAGPGAEVVGGTFRARRRARESGVRGRERGQSEPIDI